MMRKRAIKGSKDFRHIWIVKERDSTGALVKFNLTGFTGKIFIYSLDRTTFLVNGAVLTGDDLANGQVSYLVQAAATATLGLYLARLEFKDAGTQIIYTDEFEWSVEDVKTA